INSQLGLLAHRTRCAVRGVRTAPVAPHCPDEARAEDEAEQDFHDADRASVTSSAWLFAPARQQSPATAAPRRFPSALRLTRLGPGDRRAALQAAAHRLVWCGSLSGLRPAGHRDEAWQKGLPCS